MQAIPCLLALSARLALLVLLPVSPKRSAFWNNQLMHMYPVDEFDQNATVTQISENNDPDRIVRYVPDEQRWYRLDPEPVIPDEGRLLLHFGDSSTFGWGLIDRGQAYPGALDHMLPKDTHSINLGVPGYSSLQGLRYVEQMLPLHHDRIDAITLYFGNNDSTENGSPDTDKIRFEAWSVHGLLSQLPLYRVMRDLIPTRLNENEKPRVNPSEYEQNLQAMIELSRSHEIQVVVIMPPKHLSWPPGHLMHGTDLTPHVQNSWVLSEMGEAKRLYDEGKVLIHRQDDECEQRFRGAIEHDWVTPRIKAAWQIRLRGLTAELQVPLVETQETYLPAEYPWAFEDYCHPSSYVHKQIAQQVVDSLDLR